MADGRSRDEWGRMSSLLAVLANCHRDPKRSREYRASDFNPHARPRREHVSVDRLADDVMKFTEAKAKGRR